MDFWNQILKTWPNLAVDFLLQCQIISILKAVNIIHHSAQ